MLFMVFISLFISCHHSFSQITRLLFSLGLFSGRPYHLRAWQRLTTFRLASRRYVPMHSLLTKTKLSKNKGDQRRLDIFPALMVVLCITESGEVNRFVRLALRGL